MTDVRLVACACLETGSKALASMTDVRLVGTGNSADFKRRCAALSEVSTVRLAVARESPKPHERTTQALQGDPVTDVRLARGNANHRGEESLTDVRLVSGVIEQQMESGLARPDYHRQLPALLVSFAYFKQFSAQRERYCFRDYSLDSGAFTAKKTGIPVDLDGYTAACQRLLADDPQCTEVFALDEIGNPEASLRNTETMWRVGVQAIPTYHYGSPVEALLELRRYPKIALGGAVGLHAKEKRRWVEACFARLWPKRIHGFGMMARDLLFAVPFESVDASNWELAPAGFGNYKSMGKPHRAPRGAAVNLRAEVEWYLKLERELKQRWRRELDSLPGREAVTV